MEMMPVSKGAAQGSYMLRSLAEIYVMVEDYEAALNSLAPNTRTTSEIDAGEFTLTGNLREVCWSVGTECGQIVAKPSPRPAYSCELMTRGACREPCWHLHLWMLAGASTSLPINPQAWRRLHLGGQDHIL